LRFTKAALLTFGIGLVLALVVVAAELNALQRLASGVMALGLVTIPIGMIVDWRRATRAARPMPRRRAKGRTRRVPPARRRARPRRATGPNR